jgi:hypothetical protein
VRTFVERIHAKIDAHDGNKIKNNGNANVDSYDPYTEREKVSPVHPKKSTCHPEPKLGPQHWAEQYRDVSTVINIVGMITGCGQKSSEHAH